MRVLSALAGLAAASCASVPTIPAAADAERLRSRAEVLSDQGYDAEAILLIRAAAAIAPAGPYGGEAVSRQAALIRKADAAIAAGEAAAHRGQTSAAQKAYLQALAIDPSRRDAVEALQRLGAARPSGIPILARSFPPPSLRPGRQVSPLTDFRFLVSTKDDARR